MKYSGHITVAITQVLLLGILKPKWKPLRPAWHLKFTTFLKVQQWRVVSWATTTPWIIYIHLPCSIWFRVHHIIWISSVKMRSTIFGSCFPCSSDHWRSPVMAITWYTSSTSQICMNTPGGKQTDNVTDTFKQSLVEWIWRTQFHISCLPILTYLFHQTLLSSLTTKQYLFPSFFRVSWGVKQVFYFG